MSTVHLRTAPGRYDAVCGAGYAWPSAIRLTVLHGDVTCPSCLAALPADPAVAEADPGTPGCDHDLRPSRFLGGTFCLVAGCGYWAPSGRSVKGIIDFRN